MKKIFSFTFFSHVSWLGVVLFMLFCAICLERALNNKKQEYHLLVQMKNSIEEEIKKEQFNKQNLTLKLNSQSDPAWVELILMKELGLVPEGQKKIVFKTR